MSHLRGNILKTNTVIHSNNRNGQTERKTKKYAVINQIW